MRNLLFMAIGLLVLLGPSLQAQSKGTLLTVLPSYHLQPGDALGVVYRYTPEYNQVVAVQPDGNVSLQLLGQIQVRGLTLEEATNVIEQAAGRRLRNPEVSLELKDFEKPHFTVLGEVGTPGRYELRGPLTVEDGLAIAGGLKLSARHRKLVLIHRINDSVGETELIDYHALEKPKRGMELRPLRAGDIIVVPTSTLSKVERYVKIINTGVYYNPVP